MRLATFARMPMIAAAAVGSGIGLAVAAAALPVVVLVATLAAAVMLLVVDRSALWAGSLLLFAALPLAYLPVPDVLLTISPPVGVLVVLALRVLLDHPDPPRVVLSPAALLVLAFAAWLALSVVASTYRPVTLGWAISFSALVVLPALLAMADPKARDALRRTWIVLGALLGTFAIVEAFIIQSNPVFEAAYSGSSRTPLDQTWSVYRATTTLGHPIANGTFFAVAVPLALGAALRRRSPAVALATAVTAGGVVASGSRSAFAAMLAGTALVLLAPTVGARTPSVGGSPAERRGGLPGAAKVSAAVALVGTVMAGSAYLAVRDTSGEGAESAAFRVTQLPVALESILNRPLLGVGPGAASLSQESLLARIGGAGAFESFWLELAVGAGIPGVALGVGVVVAAVTTALRSGAPDVAGAVTAWAVSATFANALEGGRPGLLLLGAVLAMGFGRGGTPIPRWTTEASRRQKRNTPRLRLTRTVS